MSLPLQDLLVTGVAVVALIVLLQRVAGIVRPSDGRSSCDRCAACPTAGRSANPPGAPAGVIRLVPTGSLRSRDAAAPVERRPA
jgi:hypothetical protein